MIPAQLSSFRIGIPRSRTGCSAIVCHGDARLQPAATAPMMQRSAHRAGRIAYFVRQRLGRHLWNPDHAHHRDPRTIDSRVPLCRSGDPVRRPDDECRRGHHRRRARWPPGDGLRLRIGRPFRAGRPDSRTVRAAPVGRCRYACRRIRHEPRPVPRMARDDGRRKAGWARRTMRRNRHARHGDLGCRREDCRLAAPSLSR